MCYETIIGNGGQTRELADNPYWVLFHDPTVHHSNKSTTSVTSWFSCSETHELLLQCIYIRMHVIMTLCKNADLKKVKPPAVTTSRVGDFVFALSSDMVHKKCYSQLCLNHISFLLSALQSIEEIRDTSLFIKLPSQLHTQVNLTSLAIHDIRKTSYSKLTRLDIANQVTT